jgi:hypothetical protein
VSLVRLIEAMIIDGAYYPVGSVVERSKVPSHLRRDVCERAEESAATVPAPPNEEYEPPPEEEFVE